MSACQIRRNPRNRSRTQRSAFRPRQGDPTQNDKSTQRFREDVEFDYRTALFTQPRTENTRGNLLEHLWLELQTDLANQSPWSAHIVAGDSGHQVHLDQPKLVAYSIAVITDIHRLYNQAKIGIEHQEPTDRTRLEFRAATWLHDSLVIEPHVAIPGVNVSRNLG